jgi:acrylyl-CoA reductase (NADPH)
VALLGVDSVMAPKAIRLKAWERLARDIDSASLDTIATELNLSEAVGAGQDIIAGKIKGRVVVDVNR